MKKRYDLNLFHEMMIDSLDICDKETDFPSHFYESFFAGDTTLYQKQMTERVQFDKDWITTIESYFPSIDRITRNIKTNLKYEEEILPIEKVKRIGSASIQHLNNHTQYIRDYDENTEEIIPQQLLTDLSEIDYGIYENRFIMTLIFKLKDYIYERIKLIRQKLYATRKTHLNMTTKFVFGEAQYDIDFNVKQAESVVQRQVDEQNIITLARAERLYKLIINMTNTSFIKTMKQYRKVVPPIIKTQIILKNPDFRNAYLLWMFLDKNHQLNYNTEITSRQKRFTDAYKKNLNQMMLSLFSTMLKHDLVDNDETFQVYERPVYKEIPAKILNQLPGEFSIDPDAYIMENQTMNQYYLTEMEKRLKKSFEGEENTLKVSLKSALEDAIEINNKIFESYFKYNADDDIFKRLVVDTDPVSTLADAYEKQKVATLVRSIKEQDFKRAIELEKKWNYELLSRQKALIASETEQSETRILEAIEIEKKKYDEKIALEMAYVQKESRSLVAKAKLELTAYRKQLKNELTKERKRIKAEEKVRVEKEKQILKRQKELERKKLLRDKEKEKMLKLKKIQKDKMLLTKKHEKDMKSLTKTVKKGTTDSKK